MEKKKALTKKKVLIIIATVLLILVVVVISETNKKADEKRLNELVSQYTTEAEEVADKYKLKDVSVEIVDASLDSKEWESFLKSSNFDKLSYKKMQMLDDEMPDEVCSWGFIVGEDKYYISGDEEGFYVIKNGEIVYKKEKTEIEETPKIDEKDVQKATCDDGSYTYSRPLSYNEKLQICKDYIVLQENADNRDDIDYLSDEELEEIYENEVYSVIRAKYNITNDDIFIIFVDEDGEILEEAYNY